MNPEQVLDLTRQAMKLAVLLSAPILIFGLVAGVLMNIFQAVAKHKKLLPTIHQLKFSLPKSV